MAYEPWQIEEIKKCKKDFFYFCEKYIKVIHPIKGLVPFYLYEFQKRVIRNYEQHHFNIVSKFRQAGLTTETVIWCLWRCLFMTDQRIMVLSKSDREAIGIGKIVQNAKNNLPDWLKPIMNCDNDHEKEFADTGSVLWFFPVQGARSRALTYLIIDEAAFIPQMEDHWKAMYPTLATGGKCIVISTVNGVGNWYEDTYTKAQDKKNQFNVIDIEYTEHPEYRDPEWARKMRANLGEQGWLQEIMRSFLGSGETYINSTVITEMEKRTKPPIKKLFPEWDNTKLDDDELENEEYEKGAMWIWEDPRPNVDYIISFDCAEGMGEQGDYSAFHVFNLKTLEQVAEFYSNDVPIHKFAQVLSEVGNFYNTALLIGEHDTGPGLATLNRLEHSIHYENIYYSVKGKAEKSGVTMTKTLRPVFLETLQTCFINNLTQINSIRVIRELRTFCWNKQKKRAEAKKGYHDDLVMSCAIALQISDAINRDIAPHSDMYNDFIGDKLKDNSIDRIREILKTGIPPLEDFEDDAFTEEDMFVSTMFKPKRQFDDILKEFNW